VKWKHSYTTVSNYEDWYLVISSNSRGWGRGGGGGGGGGGGVWIALSETGVVVGRVWGVGKKVGGRGQVCIIFYYYLYYIIIYIIIYYYYFIYYYIVLFNFWDI
jgi:hypothetical protein